MDLCSLGVGTRYKEPKDSNVIFICADDYCKAGPLVSPTGYVRKLADQPPCLGESE